MTAPSRVNLLVPLSGEMVAPRFDVASEVLIARVRKGRLAGEPRIVLLPGPSADALCSLVLDERITDVAEQVLRLPVRIGVWGLSYGGFFTLLGVTEMPATFRAAVDVAGVLARTLDYFQVPAKEKAEVLGAFAAHKGEVNTGFAVTAGK